MLDEAEVAIVPGEAFGTPGYVRLSYALGDDDLVEGVGPHREARRRGALSAGRLQAGRRPSWRTLSDAGRLASAFFRSPGFAIFHAFALT